ncbi:hypothetical protein ENUP19_0068G0014 [Entamoeba nuttalli]|uniref:PUM-HD domain-containing protein n=1 Tax=Entamoeba nuttalli TaxID=412467 RepID=A0ABQ0DEJ3_9EUKA
MSETYRYLEELSRIIKVDEENRESIIWNSVEGIKGEEDSIFCNKKGSFLVEEFVGMYGREELDEMMKSIGKEKYYIIINDAMGSRVIESIYKRYLMIIGTMKEKEREESNTIITEPIYELIKEEEKENKMEEEKKYTIKELLTGKYSAHVISEMIEVMSQYSMNERNKEIIEKISEYVIDEETHEIEIESIPIIIKLISNKMSNIGKQMIRIINNNSIPINDPNWSIIVEESIKVMDDINLKIFSQKYITPDIINDGIGNHVIQIFIERSEEIKEVIEKILKEIDIIISKKYFMLIVNVMKNIRKIGNKKEEDEIIKRIKNHLCGRGNIFEEGRKEWMKGKREFIEYGYCMILEMLIEQRKKDMMKEFYQLKEQRIEEYINNKEGSHVVEKIIEYNTNEENNQLIEMIRGKIWRISMNKNGSFVIEKLFIKSSIDGKLKIIEEMNSNYEEIEKNFIGRKVIEKMNIIEYRNNITKWKRLMNMKKQIIETIVSKK